VTDVPEKDRDGRTGASHRPHPSWNLWQGSVHGPSPPVCKSITLDVRRQISVLSWGRESCFRLDVRFPNIPVPLKAPVESLSHLKASQGVLGNQPATTSTAIVPSSGPVQGRAGFPSGAVQHPTERRMGESPESKARSAENPGTQAATRPSSFRSEGGSGTHRPAGEVSA
jgi:hypothetical protein